MTAQLLAFSLTSLLIIVVPGPDLILLLRNAARGGRPGASATAMGIMLGNAVLAAAAVAGLTALLTGSEVLYTAVRIAGAVYLAYLGVRSLVDFVRRGREGAVVSDGAVVADGAVAAEGAVVSDGAVRPAHPAPALTAVDRRGNFRQGLMSNLLNPKVAAFYLSLFPQFQLPGMSQLSQHLLLAGLFWSLALLWYILVVAVLGSVQRVLLRRDVQRGMSGVAGVALVGLGATLAARG
ncbi:LysE family translocator [Kitasatospora viridis]|uniref:Threonine/homoserine/homoserine lactone efflux protein n=1 Tax=Kitasatospora viridis TaxID=281105 RepID=A0A561SEB3_9ACTN|nr:LysE family translocator [Kitasatospora viridis]TWF73202.1 threonine/homoserine/homoserine lactone efflux protein [Kitasatospora viridis]